MNINPTLEKDLAKAGQALQKRPFWWFVALALLAFLAAGLAFYFYAYKISPPDSETGTEFKIEKYQQTLENLKNRETKIQQGIDRQYQDIFR